MPRPAPMTAEQARAIVAEMRDKTRDKPALQAGARAPLSDNRLNKKCALARKAA